jgi:hypothetical protein
MLGHNAPSFKIDRTVTGVTFLWFLSMNLPDDDNPWSKHGAVILITDSNGDNQRSEKKNYMG